MAHNTVVRSEQTCSYDRWLARLDPGHAAVLAYPNPGGKPDHSRISSPTAVSMAKKWKGWAKKYIPDCADNEGPAAGWLRGMPRASHHPQAVRAPTNTLVTGYALRITEESENCWAVQNTCMPTSLIQDQPWRRHLTPAPHGPIQQRRDPSKEASKVVVCWRCTNLAGVNSLGSVLGTHLNSPATFWFLCAAGNTVRLKTEQHRSELNHFLRQTLPLSNQRDRHWLARLAEDELADDDPCPAFPRTSSPLEVAIAIVAHGLHIELARDYEFVQPELRTVPRDDADKRQLLSKAVAVMGFSLLNWTPFVKVADPSHTDSWVSPCGEKGFRTDFCMEQVMKILHPMAILTPGHITRDAMRRAAASIFNLAEAAPVRPVPANQIGPPCWARTNPARGGPRLATKQLAVYKLRQAGELPDIAVLDWAQYLELYQLQQAQGGARFWQPNEPVLRRFEHDHLGPPMQASHSPARESTQSAGRESSLTQAEDSENGPGTSSAQTTPERSVRPDPNGGNCSFTPPRSTCSQAQASPSASPRSQCPPRQRGLPAAAPTKRPARALARLGSLPRAADLTAMSGADDHDTPQFLTRARRRLLEVQLAEQRPPPPPSQLPIRLDDEVCPRRSPARTSSAEVSGASGYGSH